MISISNVSSLTQEIDYFYHRTRSYPQDIKEKERLCQYIEQCVEYLQELCIDEAKQLDPNHNKPLHKSNKSNKSNHKKPKMRKTQRIFLENMTQRSCTSCTKWKVHKFGSETWGTSIRGDSDIDIAIRLNFRNSRSDKVYLLQRLSQMISENDHDDTLRVQILLHAKYPIIRIYHKQFQNIKADISIADRYCLKRNQLIIEYIDYYQQQFGLDVKKLIVFIKYWSKQRGINGAYYGYLSSFGYTLMILHFVHHFVAKHYDPKGYDSSLAFMVLKFFEFYAFSYTAQIHSVSISGELGEKYDKTSFMQVVDPVNGDNNVAKHVHYYQYITIQREFARGANILRSENVRMFKELTANTCDDEHEFVDSVVSSVEISSNESAQSVISVDAVTSSSVCDENDMDEMKNKESLNIAYKIQEDII